MYARLHGIETVVLRYFNVYGPREPLKGIYAPVIGIFKRQRDQGTPLTIVGDGKQRRDFTHVSDVVRANLLASSLPSRDVFQDSQFDRFTVFNIGSGKNYSVQEIADFIDPNQEYVPTRPGEARETLADTSRAKKFLGWTPKVDVKDVINSY
jgi:UDP-glucose 4-epimerase